ncbi:MAG: cell division protein ZapA [Pseudomonadota bacterium]
MSNVTLHIGGRSFTVACAQGEEKQVAELGNIIDRKLHALGSAAAGQNETRMLLFAALLLADELHEARSGLGAPAAPPPPVEDPELARRLDDIAGALEECAKHLEEAAQDA